MIRASDLLPLTTRPLTPTTSTRGADPARPVSWFDDAMLGAGPSIGTDLRAGARGLSAGQHAERVLAHLLGGADERA